MYKFFWRYHVQNYHVQSYHVQNYHVQKKGAQPKPRSLFTPLFFLSVPGMQYSLYWHPNTFGNFYTSRPDQAPDKHISRMYDH